jgi:hypothetical protein
VRKGEKVCPQEPVSGWRRSQGLVGQAMAGLMCRRWFSRLENQVWPDAILGKQPHSSRQMFTNT